MSQIIQLKITLKGSKPAVWRRLLVPEEMTMKALHCALNAVMGWMDSHLHEFNVNGQRITGTEIDGFEDLGAGAPSLNEKKIKLREVLDTSKTFDYIYDFGDGWVHRVETEKSLPADPSQKYPICLAGKNACPPEDCGGMGGFEDFKQIMANPKHQEYKERLEWFGRDFDPGAFDPEEFNSLFPRRRLTAKKQTGSLRKALL